jgi:hypothetical protein
VDGGSRHAGFGRPVRNRLLLEILVRRRDALHDPVRLGGVLLELGYGRHAGVPGVEGVRHDDHPALRAGYDKPPDECCGGSHHFLRNSFTGDSPKRNYPLRWGINKALMGYRHPLFGRRIGFANDVFAFMPARKVNLTAILPYMRRRE